jgi:CrcB protein
MLHYLLVATGGALGAMARYWVYNAAPLLAQQAALATLLVNSTGSLLIGVAYVLLVEKGQLGPEWRNLLSVGFLGAFTTYSTYSLDALRFLQLGQYGAALLYAFGTLFVCVLLAWAGLLLARLVF